LSSYRVNDKTLIFYKIVYPFTVLYIIRKISTLDDVFLIISTFI